jgi:hypothetical protein
VADTDFRREPDEVNAIHGGIQRRYRFDNGYGASVVQHAYSYGGDRGLWELAVTDHAGRLTYDTPVTNDVIGCLTEAAVEEQLDAIAALPAKDGAA